MADKETAKSVEAENAEKEPASQEDVEKAIVEADDMESHSEGGSDQVP
jgi:hypothetical protein